MPALLIGKNRVGSWVLSDPLGLTGGLFASSTAALRFAQREHCRTVLIVSYPLEFGASTPANAAANDLTAHARHELQPQELSGQAFRRRA